MSLDFSLYRKGVFIDNNESFEHVVADFNITHNLVPMAKECGAYEVLWRPNENGYTTANQIISILETSLQLLIEKAEYFSFMKPFNNWGTYEDLVTFIKNTLEACIQWPNSFIKVHP